MGFFISDAAAQAGAPAGQSPVPMLLMIVGMFVIFYFFLIRPQNKRAKEHKNMVDSLSKGDEIVTNGGIMGRVADLGDDYMLLEVSQGVNIRMQRVAIANVLPKGTLKSL